MSFKKIKKTSQKNLAFPKKAYSFVLWLDEAEDTLLYPVRRVYKDLKSINLMMNILHQDDQKGSSYFLDFASIIPLTLEKLLPLKKDPKENDEGFYTTWDRIHSFVQALKYPFLYNVLVVPTREKEASQLSAIITFDKSQKIDTIEKFMTANKLPIAQNARHAAIYSVDNAFGYDVSQDKFVLDEQNFSKAIEYKKL